MPNDHGIADSLKELQSVAGDLLPATILSTTFPTVPVPPGMTLGAFATRAYVRSGVDLVYCDQAAQPVTLTGADGTYWLSISEDTWTDYAQWTRQYGTMYLTRPSSTQPADVDGLLVFCQLTVAGGAITVVTPIASRSTLAAAWRGLLALGTLATQNAGAVAITGGSVAGLSSVNTTLLGLSIAPDAGQVVNLAHNKGSGQHGMIVRPVGGDAGAYEIIFVNNAGTVVGSISSTSSATAFNTSSDARLKAAIAPLTGALDVIRALRPVQFRWQADGSQGHGFVSQEVMTVIPDAVSGLPDAVRPDGSVQPQQMDHSRLVVWLVGACQALAARVEALEARYA